MIRQKNSQETHQQQEIKAFVNSLQTMSKMVLDFSNNFNFVASQFAKNTKSLQKIFLGSSKQFFSDSTLDDDKCANQAIKKMETKQKKPSHLNESSQKNIPGSMFLQASQKSIQLLNTSNKFIKMPPVIKTQNLLKNNLDQSRLNISFPSIERYAFKRQEQIREMELLEQIARNTEKNMKWSMMMDSKKDNLNLDIDKRFLEINFDFQDITQKYSNLFSGKSDQQNKEKVQKSNLIIQPSFPNVQLVTILTGVFETSFNLYYQRKMDFNKVKSFCSQNVLANIIKMIRSKCLSRLEIRDMDDLMVKQIIPYIKYKYPHSEEKRTSKRLQKIIDHIDTYNQNQNDIVFKSGIIFNLKKGSNPDYSPQIMAVIDAIRSMPDQDFDGPENGNMYSNFEDYITDLYGKMLREEWHEERTNQMSQKWIKEASQGILKMAANNQRLDGSMNQNILMASHLDQVEKKANFVQRQKVGQYSQMLVGRKIDENMMDYPEKKQINEGKKYLKIRDSTLVRIVSKWCEQLSQRYFQSSNYISEKTSPFRCTFGNGNQSETYFPMHAKLKLIELFENEKQVLNEKKVILLNNMYEFIAETLQRNLFDYFTDASPSREADVGTFVAVMFEAKQNYLLNYLNILIHSILRVQQKFMEAHVWSRPRLVSYTIGDLIRCKIISKETEIIGVYKELSRESKKKDGCLKILRIKNRLNKGTKDILINVRFGKKKTMVGEIQLGIKNEMTDYLKKADTFSHYIYELIRGSFGAISQLCGVWAVFDQRFSWFSTELLKKNSQRMFKNPEPLKKKHSEMHKIQKYPFWCCECDKMQTGLEFVHHNFYCSRNLECSTPHRKNFRICGQCIFQEPESKKELRDKVHISQIPQGRYFYAADISENVFSLKKLYYCNLKNFDKQFIFIGSQDSQNSKKHELYYDLSKKSEKQFLKRHLIYIKNGDEDLFDHVHVQKMIVEDYMMPKIFKEAIKKQSPSLQLEEIQLRKNHDFSDIFKPFDGKFNNVTEIRLQNIGIMSMQPLCRAFPSLERCILRQKRALKDFSTIQLWKNTLSYLYFENNFQAKIPPQIFSLTSLKSLELSNCKIIEIPSVIGQLKNLKTLQLNSNELSSLPYQLCSLKKLQYLACDRNKILTLPEQIGNLRELRFFSFGINLLSELPESVYQLKQLTDFQIDHNNFTEIDQRIFVLQNLVNLFVDNNQISKIVNSPSLPQKPIKINQIILGTNQFELIPFPHLYSPINQDLTFYQDIKGLYLRRNSIKELPINIGKMSGLMNFEIDYNFISCLPDSFCDLTNLIGVVLSFNKIKKLPEQIGKLINIEEFLVNSNQLEELPQSFYLLENMTKLNLSFNKISSFDQHIYDLESLEYLDASYNCLKNLPDQFGCLNKLRTLLINDNNFEKEWSKIYWADLQIKYLATDASIFLSVINKQTFQIDESFVPEGLKGRMKYKDGRISIKTIQKSGKHYCGKNMNFSIKYSNILRQKMSDGELQDCEKKCGVVEGLNCEKCMKLDLCEWGLEKQTNKLINSAGRICEMKGNKCVCLEESQVNQIMKKRHIIKDFNQLIECNEQKQCQECTQLSDCHSMYGLYQNLLTKNE